MTDRQDDTEEEQRQRAARRQGLAYQGGVEAVAAILIAAGLGYWADEHFGTSPLWLLIGTAIGFGSFTLRLVRLGRRLNEEPPEGAAPTDEKR